LGLGLDKSIGNWTLKASTDAFLYLLSDKIISAPTQADPNLWLPYNIGKVRSSGIDANAGFIYKKNDWLASLMAKYSYQSAVDKTEGSSTFGEQIPYVAKNTFNLNCSVGYRTWRAEVIWNLRSGRKDSYGEMPDWNTLDAIISKEFRMRTCGPLTVFINGKNLNNCKYESVSGYPMPGISLTGGISFKF